LIAFIGKASPHGAAIEFVVAFSPPEFRPAHVHFRVMAPGHTNLAAADAFRRVRRARADMGSALGLVFDGVAR